MLPLYSVHQIVSLPTCRCNIFPFTFRAKHPVKVHVWGGIILRGPTGVCILEGTMDEVMYVDILKNTLVPFIKDVYPHSHRFIRITILNILLD